MIFDNPFTKDDWIECSKRNRDGIRFDALLYDAHQNVRLSIQVVYNLYIDAQSENIKPLPKLINIWVLEHLCQFFRGEIQSTDLVSKSENDSKSNRNDIFNPFLPNSRMKLASVDSYCEAYGITQKEYFNRRSKSGIKELKDFPGKFTKPQFGDVGTDALNRNKTTLKKRKKRLRRVERLLDMYYQSDTTEKEQIIFKHLDEHYIKSRSEQTVFSNQDLK